MRRAPGSPALAGGSCGTLSINHSARRTKHKHCAEHFGRESLFTWREPDGGYARTSRFTIATNDPTRGAHSAPFTARCEAGAQVGTRLGWAQEVWEPLPPTVQRPELGPCSGCRGAWGMQSSCEFLEEKGKSLGDSSQYSPPVGTTNILILP